MTAAQLRPLCVLALHLVAYGVEQVDERHVFIPVLVFGRVRERIDSLCALTQR